MLKLWHRGVFSLFLIILVALILVNKKVASASDSSWIDSPLYVTKVSDIAAANLPSSVFSFGNVDCTFVYNDKCSLDTQYGTVADSSLQLNGKWFPIYDFAGNKFNFFPIPYSSTALTFSSGPIGSFVTLNQAVSLTPKFVTKPGSTGIAGVDNLLLDHFQISSAPTNRVADKTGKLLQMDANSLAFSTHGDWLVGSSSGIATLAVNTTNGNVIPFGKIFNYGNGQNPRPENAISSDGRFAAVATMDASTFILYDISTCSAVPNSINSPVSCQSRELVNTGYMQQQISGYAGIYRLRFISNDTLAFYAARKEGTVTKYALYTLSTNPAASTRPDYLAMGDSFISGEGAYHYQAGTDTDTNHCHLSVVSHPYLLSLSLGFSAFHSVACSGATTDDITNRSTQYQGQTKLHSRKDWNDTKQTNNILSLFKPGDINQLDFISPNQPKTIALSVGGNDIGFAGIVRRCLEVDSCYSTYEDRVELVREINNLLLPRLTNTYQQVKNAAPPDTRIYVIGYPQAIKPGGNCDLNVPLDSQETTFAQQITDYLDKAVEVAAKRTGVQYIDTQNTLAGYRLCEAPPGMAAVNGLTSGGDIPDVLHGPLGSESFHPNAFGHQLLTQAILSSTSNLTQSMPTSNLTEAMPSESSLAILNSPHSGRTINTLNYNNDLSDDTQYRQDLLHIVLNSNLSILKSLSKVTVILNSSPINLGDYTTDQHGNLDLNLSLPNDLALGFHTLHVYGTSIDGQPVDIQKVIDIIEPAPVVPAAPTAAATASTSIVTSVQTTSNAAPATITSSNPSSSTSSSTPGHGLSLSLSGLNKVFEGPTAAAFGDVLGSSVLKTPMPSHKTESISANNHTAHTLVILTGLCAAALAIGLNFRRR